MFERLFQGEIGELNRLSPDLGFPIVLDPTLQPGEWFLCQRHLRHPGGVILVDLAAPRDPDLTGRTGILTTGRTLSSEPLRG